MNDIHQFFHQARIIELDAGKIDGHREERIFLILPFPHFFTDGTEYETVQLRDGSVFLEHGDELSRGKYPLSLIIPTDQSLRTDQPLCFNVHLRLIIDKEISIGKRSRHIRLYLLRDRKSVV